MEQHREDHTISSHKEHTISSSDPVIQPLNKPRFTVPVSYILVGIALLIFGVFGGVMLSKNLHLNSSQTKKLTPVSSIEESSDTILSTEWKTYTDEFHNFSLQYPPNWTPQIPSSDDSWVIFSGNTGRGDADFSVDYAITDATPQIESSSVQNRIEMWKDYHLHSTSFAHGEGEQLSKETIVVDGKSATKYTIQVKSNGSPSDLPYMTAWIFIPLEKQIMRIEMNWSNDATIPNQILSSYKFLASDVTTLWKTYTNTQFGFSFQYPKNVTVTEQIRSPERIQIMVNKEQMGSISIEASSTYLSGDVARYMNTEAVGTRSIGGVLWKTFLPRGYGENPELGIPLFGIRVEKNNILYTIEFTKQTDTIPDQDRILFTFKFLDQTTDTSNWKAYFNSESTISFSYPSSYKLTACDPQSKFPSLVVNIQTDGKAIPCGIGAPADINIKYYPGKYSPDTSSLYSSRYKFTRSFVEVGDKKIKSEKIELISLLPGQEPGPDRLPSISINVPYPLKTDPDNYQYFVINYFFDIHADKKTIDQILSTFQFTK